MARGGHVMHETNGCTPNCIACAEERGELWKDSAGRWHYWPIPKDER